MTHDISQFLADGFERELYCAALRNLNDIDNKLRFNNFAYAMRELVRHVLHRRSPDASVRQCVWYKDETEKPGAISRRQRAYFAVQGGLSDDYIKDTLHIETEEIHRSLIDSVDDLSKFTHIESNTFGLAEADVETHINQTLEAVTNLFLTIRNCRKQIIESLWEQIDDNVIDEALRETINSIDEIATHHCIDEVCTEEVEITAIDQHRIVFMATGTISCELQWGSSSDVRRGDGAVLSDGFPFTCYLSSPVDDPSSIEGHEDGIHVDTSSWWENYYDET